jgi:LysR family transcriptional regulator, glycine cleavage system transcriptional activator
MSRPLPPLDLLIGFESAARQLSFSKAGEEIYLTQSAISRQVRKLEDYLGLVLFERRHRALELTENGRVLFEAVSESLSRLSDVVASLRKDTAEGAIKVSTTTSFAALWLVPRLTRFRAQCPEIALNIDADNRMVDLKQGVVDIAIRYCTADLVSPDTDICLSSEEIFPVCSPALLSRNGRKLTCVEDLQHHTLLRLGDPQNSWPWLQWPYWLEQVGGQLPLNDIGFRFSQLDQMIQAAVMGHGVALGSSPLVNLLIEEGLLVAPLSEKIVSPRSYYLCYGPRRNTSIQAFVDWLRLLMDKTEGNL